MLEQGPFWGLSPCSRIKLSSSSMISKHLLMERISAATKKQRKHSLARGWVRSDCREIAIMNQPRIQNLHNGFVKAREAFSSEAASFHSECLWLVNGPLSTIICLDTHTHTHTHTHTLHCDNSGQTLAEELMKGSRDNGCYVYLLGVSWLHPLPHQANSSHLPSHQTLPCSSLVQAIPFPGGPHFTVTQG